MLTDRTRKVLDWLTNEGADAWCAHAVAEFGEERARQMLAAKVSPAREAAYDDAADKRPLAERAADDVRK